MRHFMQVRPYSKVKLLPKFEPWSNFKPPLINKAFMQNMGIVSSDRVVLDYVCMGMIELY